MIKKFIPIYIFIVLCLIITNFEDNLVFGASNNQNFKEKINYTLKNINYNSNELQINKVATPLHNTLNQEISDRTYTINLNVKAKQEFLNEKEKQDIILVLDKSGSMKHSINDNNSNPFNILKKAVNNFSNKILNSSKDTTKIELIAFSSNFLKLEDFNYYPYKYASFNDPIYGMQRIIIANDNYGYYGILSNGEQVRIYHNLYGKGNFYVHELSANNKDANVIQPFTNNYQDIKTALNSKKLIALGGTDTQSALNLVNEELNKVKDDGRQKYVILFTDGMPSGIINESFGASSLDYFKRCVDVSKRTYDNLIKNHPNVKFISLGFKSQDSEKYPNLTHSFLSYIQNWNNQINGKNLIFINNDKDINSVYNTIANRIIQASSICNDALIRDFVPNNFEIIKDSASPKGAIIKGNQIYWSKQTITGLNKTFTFKIKAKDDYFGKELIPSNAYADITYTNLNSNKKNGQIFNIPKINVLNECNLKLKPDMTISHGDKIVLKDLIKNSNINYGPKDGYIYTWSDNHNHKIVLTNQKINSLVGNNFDKNSKNIGIPITKDTTFTLQITHKNINKNKLFLKDSINIKVITPPHITITKTIIDDNNKPVISKDLFSLVIKNITDNSIWNADINQYIPFTINHITMGTYKIDELNSEGYVLESIKINGKEINKNKPTFIVDKASSNIQINITNKKTYNKYFHDTKIIQNKFITN